MNNLKHILNEYDIKLNSFKEKGNIIFLDTNKGKLVYKENSNNYDIYEYLKTRNFNFFPRCLNNKNSNLELTEYIREKDVPRENRLKDLIHLTGILHKNTSFNKEIDFDEIKDIYENITNNCKYLKNYYDSLNNYIDTKVFMSPSEYLLVSNMDLINYCLDFSLTEIDTWYNSLKNDKTIRYSLIHNNLDLSHILESDNKYLISWSRSKLDMPIMDIYKLYKDNYYDLNLDDFLREYEAEYRLTNNEYLFFLINLACVKKIEFTKNTYKDCYNINNYLVYLRKIAAMIQKLGENSKKV